MSIYGEGAYLCRSCGPQNPGLRSDSQLAHHQWELICQGALNEWDAPNYDIRSTGVSSQPLYIENGSGERRVSRKGLVTRKR